MGLSPPLETKRLYKPSLVYMVQLVSVKLLIILKMYAYKNNTSNVNYPAIYQGRII